MAGGSLSNYYHDCNVFKVNAHIVVMEFDLKLEKIPENYIYVKNVSETPQALYIDTPSTRYFTTEFYIPNGYVLPGKDIRIKIKLHSHVELRPYCDSLKVYCKKGCGQVVKILANPRKEVVLNIPPEINLGCIPLGEKTTAKITLPHFQKPVPFVIVSNTLTPDFSIRPMKGVVKDRPVTIEITYVPRAYITVSFPIHIYLPSLTSSPFFFCVIADTKPGLLGQLISSNNKETKEKMNVKKISKNVKIRLSLPKPVDTEQNLIWAQHQTNKFLLEKEKEKCLHTQKVDYMGRPWSYHEEFKNSEQQRFMNKVEEIKKTIQLGSYQKRDLFVDNSSDEIYDYSEFWDNIQEDMMECNDTVFNSSHAQKFQGRFMKYSIAEPPIYFSGQLQNPWFVRYVYLKKFVGAVHTICIQYRMLKRLNILKNLTTEDIEEIEKRVILLDN